MNPLNRCKIGCISTTQRDALLNGQIEVVKILGQIGTFVTILVFIRTFLIGRPAKLGKVHSVLAREMKTFFFKLFVVRWGIYITGNVFHSCEKCEAP